MSGSTECPIEGRLQLIRAESDAGIRKALREIDAGLRTHGSHTDTMRGRITVSALERSRPWYQHEAERRGIS